MAHNLVVLEWLYKADQDFGFASNILSEDEFPYYDQICFHFHQAAEKYLKAYIVMYDLPFRKMHDLRKLAAICEAHDAELRSIQGNCEFLNPFYIETRYADERFVIATQAQAQEAKRHVAEIQKIVRNALDITYEITAEILKREHKKIDTLLKKDE